MKTIQPIALGVVLSLALVACGQDEPSKTAYQASSSTPGSPQASTTVTETYAPVASAPGPTSADVPHEGPNAGSSAAPANGMAEAQAKTMLTDEQILQVTHIANLGEIDQAKLALSKSKDTRVRELAQMMVRDHRQSESKGAIVAKKDNLTQAPSPTSDSLKTDAESATRTLRADAVADFDKDYVDTQVREHQAVLDTLDQKLIANAKSENVKAYLVEVRAAVASHLQHAQDLQKDLQK